MVRVSAVESYRSRTGKRIGQLPNITKSYSGPSSAFNNVRPLTTQINNPQTAVSPLSTPGQTYKPMLQPNQAEFLTQSVPVGDKSAYAGNYNVLSAVDQMGESQLNLSNAKLAEENAKRRQANSLLSSPGAEGFESYAGGAFGGLDAEQSKYAQQIMQMAKQRGLSDDDATIAIMTALAESGLRNLNYGDRDSVGLFQQRTSQGWGTIQQILDPTYSINKFFDAYMPARGSHANPWQVAQNVQRSAFADGSNYRAQYDRAKQIVAAARGGTGTQSVASVNAASSFINSFNGRYIDFDGAFGNQCVDLFNYYNQQFGTGGFIGGVVGAKDLWYNRQMDAGYNRLGASARPNMGDVVVYGASQGGGYGHVAVVVGVNSNGSLRLLHSNAGPQGSRGATAISSLSTAGVLGYFRPKRLAR